jgi:hypothetical protein
MAYQLLLIVHVLGAMTWYGVGLPIARRMRRGLVGERPAADEALAESVRAATLSLVFGAVTLASGLGLVFAVGGFRMFGPRIHAGLGLTVLALLLGVVLRAVCRRAVGAVRAGVESARPFARRAAMLQGIVHALIAVTLVLMLWRS